MNNELKTFLIYVGRLLYGLIMDKFSYKIAMTVEATLLILLMSTFYVTSLIGNDSVFLSSSSTARIFILTFII
jgi:hypothetical protein